MNKRNLLSLLAGSVMAAILGLNASLAETGVTKDEIRIGMWTSLSGPLSLQGQSEKDGVSLWAKEVNDRGGINGRKIKLIVYDDAASPQEAQTAVRRLMDQDQVFMLIAGSASGSTLPLKGVITRAKIPFLSSFSSNINLMKPFSRYIFRNYANEDHQADGIVDAMMEDGKAKRPAIIYNSNDYGIGGYTIFEARLKQKYNIAPVAAERYNAGDQDFTAQLLRIKSANPDALLVFSFAADAGIIVRQAKELGLNVKMYGGGATATPLLLKAAGPAAIGFISVFPAPQLPESSLEPAVADYRNKLKAWYYPNGFPPGRPSLYDMFAYAGGLATQAALEKLGDNVTREGFVDALETLRDFKTGVSFPMTFTKDNHEGVTKVSVIQVTPEVTWKLLGN
jgi:branched-chain amino acid transport system substrate-binding protein